MRLESQHITLRVSPLFFRPSAPDVSGDNVVIRRNPVAAPAPPPLRTRARPRPIKVNNDYVKPTSINQRQLLKEYLAKLDDPEYVQNLTKAHVYHDKELRAKTDGPLRQPLIGSERVTYIQDSNPFFFRQKAREPASPLPPKPPQLPPKLPARGLPQIKSEPFR